MDEVYLRALQSSDLENTHQWHSDEEIFNSLVGPFRYVSLDAERIWLEKKAEYSNNEINLMICLSSKDQAIGLISVRDIDWLAKRGHLAGILIGPKEYRGKGYGFLALNIMIKHCFTDLGLNRIWALILLENEPSLRVFEKCDFQVEGHLKQHAFKDGQFKDVLLVGLCADRYFLQNYLCD